MRLRFWGLAKGQFRAQRVLSAYMVECRVALLGITTMLWVLLGITTMLWVGIAHIGTSVDGQNPALPIIRNIP